MRFAVVVIAFVSLLILNGCDKNSLEEPMVATSMFTLKDTQGKSYQVKKEGNNFTLDAGQDKIVLFDVFATWCPPCRAEIVHLSHLQRKYGDKVIIMGISIDEDTTDESLEKFKVKYKANYPLTHKGENQKLAQAIASTLGVGQDFPIPLMILYKNGQYVTHYTGSTPESVIDADITKALGQ